MIIFLHNWNTICQSNTVRKSNYKKWQDCDHMNDDGSAALLLSIVLTLVLIFSNNPSMNLTATQQPNLNRSIHCINQSEVKYETQPCSQDSIKVLSGPFMFM